MADNQDKKNNPKLPQRPNYQIWIIVSLLGLIFAVTYFNQSSSTVEILPNRFEDMVESGDVAKITIIKNQEVVEIFLKPEALANAKYSADLENRGPFAMGEGPHYSMEILDAGSFMTQLTELEKSTNQKISYEIKERHDIMSFLFNWGFLFLILFGFWFLMRRMTGGGGPGGQIFNIGKSKAALFDAENKVKITFEDVAGLDEAKEEVKEIVDFLEDPGKIHQTWW